MAGKILLGDLSGSLCVKLALADPGGRPDHVERYGCTNFEDFAEALRYFVADNGNPNIVGAAFSTSGWEVDGQIDLVHYGFKLDRREGGALLGVRGLAVVNNFVAKALAVPVLERHERVKVCGEDMAPEHVVAVIGPTQGLGGAFLSPNGRGGWVATHCEGGHGDFAPTNALEIEILKLLMARYGHVSRERAVSEPGICELWRCMGLIEGTDDADSAPEVEEILAMAYVGDGRALRVIEVQTELFAGAASDFALTTGARGGVYLSGSFLDTLGDLFKPDVFARRFHDKGRVSSYVRDIPVYQILPGETEILGISTLFD